jgi:hypothetical protein
VSLMQFVAHVTLEGNNRNVTEGSMLCCVGCAVGTLAGGGHCIRRFEQRLHLQLALCTLSKGQATSITRSSGKN